MHFLLCALEQHHQPGPGLCKMSQQRAASSKMHPGQVCPVTPSTIAHNHRIAGPARGREIRQEVELPESFTQQVNKAVAGLPHPRPTNLNNAYDSYCKMLLAAAKKNIPRGVRKAYVPCWDDECEDLLRAYAEAQTNEDRDKATNELFCRLNEKRRQRWTETVESIDFTHSSRWMWQTMNKLTGRSTTPAQCPITANFIPSLLLSNGRFPNAHKDLTRTTLMRVHELHRAVTYLWAVTPTYPTISQYKKSRRPSNS